MRPAGTCTQGSGKEERSVQSCLEPAAGLLNSCVGRSDKRNMHGFSRAQKCTIPEMGNADRVEPPRRNKTVRCRFEDAGEKQSPDKYKIQWIRKGEEQPARVRKTQIKD